MNTQPLQPGQLNTLSVFIDGRRAGTLHNKDPLTFTYTEEWLGKASSKSLSDSIPLTQGPIATPQVHAFFENLLPEGDQRKILSLRHHVSSVFGLLAVAGGDTAGALVLLPEGQLPEPPAYQHTTWEQVARHIHDDGRLDTGNIADEDDLPQNRVSISGAQFKLLLSIDDEGNPLLPLGASPSTHILKPDMVRSDMKLFATAINETIAMQLAARCKLPVAPVRYQPTVKACLVERYDRKRDTHGELRRLWQADFCQLAGTPSERKYEVDGGPSFKTCFDLVRKYSVQPAVDQRNLLRWLFFNLCIGNHDSHAKNIAMLATPDGLQLAPFYDMMCTRVYPGLGPSFAFQIGGEYAPGKLEQSHLQGLADSLEVKPRYLNTLVSDMAQAVMANVPSVVADLMPILDHSEKVLAQRLQEKIGSLAKSMQAQLGD